MAEVSPKDQLTFMICPTCDGTGRLKTLACGNCRGAGVGAFRDGQFLYWDLKISAALIHLKAFKRTADTIINTLAYIIGVSGIAALGWWLYSQGNIVQALTTFAVVDLRQLEFWNIRNGFLLWFWVSIIADAYLVYRASRRKDREHVIVRPAYQANKPVGLPAATWEEINKLGSRKRINAADGTDPVVEKILDRAVLTATSLGHREIKPLHIFAALLFTSQEAAALFSRLNVSEKDIIEGVERLLQNEPAEGGEAVFGFEAKQILIEAYSVAARNGRKKIGALNLLAPAVKMNQSLGQLLYDAEVDESKLLNAIAWFEVNDQLIENYKLYKETARLKPSSGMDRAYTALATPLLDHFSFDLTLAAKWGRLDLCVDREGEIRRAFDIIESGQTGMIFVGPLGVGKYTLIGGLAQLMVLESVPAQWEDKRLIELDIARLIGGASPAEAEERMLEIIRETGRARNIILYIKDLEKIMGVSSEEEGSLDIASILSDAISRGEIYCLASVTDENYAKHIEKTSLGNVLTKVEVKEPDHNQAILMVESKIGFLEGKYGVYFSYDALEDVVNLTGRYIHDKYLPAKAIEVLESVAVVVSRRQDRVVDTEAIAQVVTELTHIPVTKLTESESENLLNLEQRIHERMIGQEEAVKMVAASLRRARVELREGKRPIANFLFLGPTGVGKTELAKTVAETYFGQEDYMIRLDMSEYQNQDSVNKMIGSPEGVMGYLTEAVRKLPFTLILLDEVEKAHPDILNLFLQVMDDGRLTDGQGKTIDFTNSIIIATSNVGSALIQQKVREGVAMETIKEALIETELVKAMRPELINRFDGVVIFTPLDQSSVVSIAKLMLKKIGKMLLEKGYEFVISDAATAKLAELGFEPEFGARPLRRVLQEKVEDAIATKILEGGIERRDKIIVNDDLSVSVEKAQRI